MTERTRPRWRRWLLLLLSAVVAAACLAVELGSRLPASPIPGWTALRQALALSPAAAEGVLEVHFPDVGNADCVLLRQGDRAALIDAGEPGDGAAVVAYLRRFGVERLEFVLATHGHADHVGGMKAVLEALPADRLLVGTTEGAEDADPAYGEVLACAAAQGIPVEPVRAGTVYAVGEAQLHILAAMTGAEEENDRSVVARLTFGERAFLFTGDAGEPVEQALLTSGLPLEADVLKLGHHGGDTANKIAFLRRVAPTYAVATCGIRNGHGHPSVAVLERLRQLGIACLRSDMCGHIVIKTDGRSLTVDTEYAGK